MSRLVIVSVFLLFASCATIRETHYFKDKIDAKTDLNINSSVSNYYKVHIRGWAFLSSSRYVSGYFDEDVVNEYFNEIKQPKNGKLFTWLPSEPEDSTPTENPQSQTPQSPDSKDIDNKTVEIDSTGNGDGPNPKEVLDSGSVADNKPTIVNSQESCETCTKTKPTEPGSELVLILSTNAEAIATQIKNTAVNKDVLQSLTIMANKDKIELSQELASEMADIDTEIDLFILKMNSYLDALNLSEANSGDKEILLQLLKSEFREMGVNRRFDDYEELKTWFYENN